MSCNSEREGLSNDCTGQVDRLAVAQANWDMEPPMQIVCVDRAAPVVLVKDFPVREQTEKGLKLHISVLVPQQSIMMLGYGLSY